MDSKQFTQSFRLHVVTIMVKSKTAAGAITVANIVAKWRVAMVKSRTADAIAAVANFERTILEIILLVAYLPAFPKCICVVGQLPFVMALVEYFHLESTMCTYLVKLQVWPFVNFRSLDFIELASLVIDFGYR